MIEGFLLIDKPSGPTSHDVVDRIRALLRPLTSDLRPPKVGHTGTLDPFATGLLILGIGQATKSLGKLVGLDKEYEATLRLGAVSETYDRTGKITESAELHFWSGRIKNVTFELEVKKILKQFTGTIQQIPPMYSAKKVGGKKLYELARKGIEIERKPSTIMLHSMIVLDYKPPLLQLRVRCSSGTYIRSLTQDIGQALGCGAYLEELRRTAIGPFRIENATPLASITSQTILQHLQKLSTILDIISQST